MASELDVAYVAQLARLQLTAEETELFQKQLGDVFEVRGKIKGSERRGSGSGSACGPDFQCFSRR